MYKLDKPNIFIRESDTDIDYQSLDQLIMDHWEDGFPYFEECFKRFIDNPCSIQKDYLYTYFKYYLTHQFNVIHFRNNFKSIKFITEYFSNECIYNSDIFMDWSRIIFEKCLDYIYIFEIKDHNDSSSSDVLNIWDLIYSLLLNKYFRYYVYIKELNCNTLNIEHNSLIGFCALHHERLGNQGIYKILDIFVEYKDYFNSIDKTLSYFIVHWAKKVFHKNNTRSLQRHSNSLNSNKFLIKVITLLKYLWEYHFEGQNNSDEVDFSLYLFRLIDITIIPIICNYEYYKKIVDELDELNLTGYEEMPNIKEEMKRKIKGYEKMIYGDLNIFTTINQLFQFTYSKIKNHLHMYNYDHSKSVIILEYLYGTRNYNSELNYNLFDKLFNYFIYNGKQPFIKFIALYLHLHKSRKVDLPCHTIFSIISNTDNIELREQSHILLQINNFKYDYDWKMEEIHSEEYFKFLNTFTTIINHNFEIINDNNTFYKQNKTLIYEETLLKSNESLIMVSRLIELFIYLIMKISKDYSKCYISMCQFINYNLNTIHNLYQMNEALDGQNKYTLLEPISELFIILLSTFMIDPSFISLFKEYYNKNIFKQIVDKIYSKERKMDILDDILKKLTDIEEKTIEYPDEYCDPLMYVEIKTPYVLPDSDMIMEKQIIIKHLEHNQEDPFTRKPLTLKELEEYNTKEEVIYKTKLFLEKKMDWFYKSMKN